MRESNPSQASSYRSPIGQALFSVVFLVAGLWLTGCGLFTPEEPEPPVTQGDFSLPDLTVDPESALVSIVQGVESKNVDLYIHGFADSTTSADIAFHAFFDIQDLFDYQVSTGTEPPDDWLNQQERTFFPLFSGLRPVNYEMHLFPDPDRPDQFPDPSSDVIYFRKYRIWAGGDPVAIGQADLRIQRVGVSGEWKVTNWTDRIDSTAAVQTFGSRRLDSLTFQ